MAVASADSLTRPASGVFPVFTVDPF